MLRPIFAVALLLSASAVFGQTTEKLLLPLLIQAPRPGAYGSLWKTSLTLTNTSARPVQVTGYNWDPDLCIVGPASCGPIPPTPPGVSFVATVFDYGAGEGYFLLVEEGGSDAIQAQLRLQDLSRNAEYFGDELPVVREREASGESLHLLAVPLDPQVRVMLRIYDLAPSADHMARVRVFETDPARRGPYRFQIPQPPDVLVHESVHPLRVPTSGPVLHKPGYLQLNLSEMLPAAGVVRIEVIPETTGPLLWAFASITHNATQRVTLVTPQ
jgi:hypothetical protein